MKKGLHTAALDFFTYAIDTACGNILYIEPEKLSAIYVERVKCYEALNLFEHAKADNKKVLEADPGFL